MKLKRYQTITLIILLWTLVVSIQLQSRINTSAALVVEKYLGYHLPGPEVKQQAAPQQRTPASPPSPCSGEVYLPFPVFSLWR